MAVHPSAAAGFRAGASAYDRSRPDYPAEAVDELRALTGLGPGDTALDVGAGTGKWTAALASTGAHVVAVEPVDAMRDLLRADLPAAHPVAATAEDLPFAGGRFDVVTAAAAIHWFDLPRAVPELVRVVRPGGHVVAARNERLATEDWVREYDRMMEEIRGTSPSAARVPWRDALLGHRELSLVAERSVPNDQHFDADRLLTRTASVSFVAALPAPERGSVLDRVRAFAAGLPETFTMPCRTQLVVLRRHDAPGGDR